MKDYNISGFGFEICCSNEKERKAVHQLAAAYFKEHPEWIADRNDEMSARAYTYLGIANCRGIKVRYFAHGNLMGEMFTNSTNDGSKVHNRENESND